MSPITGLLGCMAFVLVLLFWRINRYEKQIYVYHTRMNKLLRAILSTMSEEDKKRFLAVNGIDPEKWKEPLSL